jgi:hypothetical protein
VDCQLFGGANAPSLGTKASLNDAPLLFNYLLHQKTDSLRQHLPGWLHRRGYNTRQVWKPTWACTAACHAWCYCM